MKATYSIDCTIVLILFQTVTVYDSADVELRCLVTRGVPSPSFRFFRNGTELDGTEEFISIEMVRVMVHQN